MKALGNLCRDGKILWYRQNCSQERAIRWWALYRKGWHWPRGKEIFVIGGAKLYEEALPLAERLDLTLVDLEPLGDTYFPKIDWSHFEKIDEVQHEGIPSYQFVTYGRIGSFYGAMSFFFCYCKLF